jgi:hypothetical protein
VVVMRTPVHTGPAADALNQLGDELRASGVKIAAGQAVSFPNIVADDCLSVACHPAPHDGPLHFCVPDTGPCRELGTPGQVPDVAAVVRRMLAPLTIPQPRAGKHEGGTNETTGDPDGNSPGEETGGD